MKKLASYNYDILDNILAGNLEKISSVIAPLSEEAKTASVPDYDEQIERPDSDFALVIDNPMQGSIKKYAKYTKELTELNIAFLEDSWDKLPEELVKVAGHNLKIAASEYGLNIPENINSIEAQASYIDNKISLEDVDEYQFTEKLASQEIIDYALPSEKRYPLNSAADAGQSIDYFNKYAHEFDPSDAIEYAKNVSKASEKFGVDISGSNIEKFASLDINSFNSELGLHLRTREKYLEEGEHKTYQDLLKTAENHGPSKVATLLERVDKTYGLDKHWGRGISNPALCVFKGQIEKTASGISLEQIRSIDRGQLSTIVGTEAVSDLISEDGLDVYNSLPRPIKKEIQKLI